MAGFPMTEPQKQRLAEVLRRIQEQADPFVIKGLPTRDIFRGTLFHSLYEGYGVLQTGEYVLSGLMANPRITSETMDLEPLLKTLLGHALICSLLASDILGAVDRKKAKASAAETLRVMEGVGLVEKPPEIN